jgi:taurine dioxygenase
MPVTATIGAEVGGVDMSQPLTDELQAEIDDALVKYKVLFFRDQHSLTPATQVRFGRAWGPLTGEPWRERVPGAEDVTIIQGYGAERFLESWHTDQCHTPEPPMACILRAVEIPPVGRDTMWADMEAVYDDLSDKMQRFLSGLSANYDLTHNYGTKAGRSNQSPMEKDLREEDVIAQADVEHPVIRTHPVSGRKCVFVNKVFTSGIVGMTDRESRAVLDFLFEQVRDPEYHVRLRWAPGTVVMWDNRSSQHRLIIDIPPQAVTRVLHRVTICGDKPI